MLYRRAFYVFAMTCLFSVMGCDFGVSPPSVDSAAATATAMEQMDKDGDGMLSEEEVEACPAIRERMGEFDLDGDKMLTSEEVLARFRLMYEGPVGLASADCIVTLNGKPLQGAQVRYIPEEFLGDATKAAEGVTDSYGFTQLAIPDDQMPSDLQGLTKMQVGLYRVKITHPSRELPAKYNTESTLGFELNPASHDEPHANFDL